jgi:cysteine desulfurase
MAVKLPIYMDNQATTQLDPRVLDAMMPYLTQSFGNAASRSHSFGWTAEAAVDRAREQIADLIGGSGKEIVFTSGATESINLALKGAAAFYKERGKHIITAQTEHKATLDTCKRLEKDGFRVTYLPVDKEGRVSPQVVVDAIVEDTIIVSLRSARRRTSSSTATRCRAWARSRSTSRPRASIWRRSRRTRCTAPRASARCGCGASRACASTRSSTAAATSAACARAR